MPDTTYPNWPGRPAWDEEALQHAEEYREARGGKTWLELTVNCSHKPDWQLKMILRSAPDGGYWAVLQADTLGDVPDHGFHLVHGAGDTPEEAYAACDKELERLLAFLRGQP